MMMLKGREPWEACVVALLIVLLLLASSPVKSFQPLPTTRSSSSLWIAPSSAVATTTTTRYRRHDVDVAITTTPSTSTTQLHVAIGIGALDAFWRNSPYVAAAVVCGFKACAADLVAQKRDLQKRRRKQQQVVSSLASPSSSVLPITNGTITAAGGAAGVAVAAMPTTTTTTVIPSSVPTAAVTTAANIQTKKTTDWQRNLAFVLYGALYQGVAQEYIYNHLYPAMFGAGTGLKTVLIKVGFDLLIQTTLITLPIAYLTKAVIYRYSFGEAARRYQDDVQNHGLWTKYFSLWGPVQCLTFSVVPEHYRVTFIACVSFFWLIILSSIASRTTTTTTTTTTSPTAANDQCSLEDGLTCNIDG